MLVYILLLLYLFVVWVISNLLYKTKAKREKYVLVAVMWAVFLLLALKADSVGIDIQGYKAQYELTENVTWNDWDYVYFEKGYVLLMKIFAKINIPFQIFMALIYGVSCWAIYFFIKAYSRNTTFSLLVFICYQFFVFYISGVRQALAMSICMFAYVIMDKKVQDIKKGYLLFMILVILASSIHQSALIFFIVLPFFRLVSMKKGMLMILFVAVSLGILKPFILNSIDKWIGNVRITSFDTLGGNYYFLIILLFFAVFGVLQKKKYSNGFLVVSVNMLALTIIVQTLFANTNLFRSSMYLQMFMIPGITHFVKCYEKKIEVLSTCVLAIVFMYIFLNDTLLANQFNLCPYTVFWR